MTVQMVYATQVLLNRPLLFDVVSVRDPLQKMKAGFIALAMIVVIAILAFRYVCDYDWVDALWMVVITISTVGYNERSQVDVNTKLLCIGVILLGVTAAAYAFTGMIEMILAGEIDRALGRRRMEKELKKLRQHTIVCGFGKSGRDLCDCLRNAGEDFVVVDNNDDQIEQASNAGYLVFDGDATDEEVLKQLGMDSAKAIVVGLPTDAENVFITLSARNLCPNIRIVASAEKASSSKKLRQAGANEVVLTHRMVADHISRLVTRPSAAHFFEVLSQASNLELEIDELVIQVDSPVASQTIAQSEIRDRHELLIVGVQPEGGEFQFNPRGHHQLAVNDTVLVMGKYADIEKFKKTNRLASAESEPTSAI